jgi:hypothetical protein
LEPSDSIDPEDALEHVLVFISHIDHIGEKLRLSIADVKQKSQMNIYKTNDESKNHFDINKLESRQANRSRYSKSQGERYRTDRGGRQSQGKPRPYSARAAQDSRTGRKSNKTCSTPGCRELLPEFMAKFPLITNPKCQGCFDKKEGRE